MITMTPETNKQMLTETIKYRFATAAARRQVQSWGRRPDILGRTANRLQGDIVVTRSSPPPPPSPWWWWWWLQTGIRAKPPWGSPPRTWPGGRSLLPRESPHTLYFDLSVVRHITKAINHLPFVSCQCTNFPGLIANKNKYEELIHYSKRTQSQNRVKLGPLFQNFNAE